MVHTSLKTIKLSLLSGHPENERIYSPTDLSDLENSLDTHGQLEPIAITNKNRIISGHRRYMSMRNLGWKECQVRIIKPDNEIVSLIEHNRHRTKTNNDLINEVRVLEKELKSYIGRGRDSARERLGSKRGERLTMVMELSKRLGVGTTKLKQLLSISNYQPELIAEIDNGKISVSAAYQIVREEFIQPKQINKNTNNFTTLFKKFLKKNNPSLEEINESLKKIYPYSIKLGGLNMDKKGRLVEQLERLRKLTSSELLYVYKQREITDAEYDDDALKKLKKRMPTLKEIENYFWKNKGYLKNVRSEITTKENTKEWNMLRTNLSSAENKGTIGRGMSSTELLSIPTAYKNKKIDKVIGILKFASDSNVLSARDDHIGWTREVRAKNREHIVNMNTCIPHQLLGYNFLGGKYISMRAVKLIKEWEKKYKTKIVAITTTSLHGSFGQYSGMKWWKNIGKSSGTMLLKPFSEEYWYWKNWLQRTHPETYAKIRENSTSPTQGILQQVYRMLNISEKEYSHHHQKGVFICPLYSNYREFLNNKISEKELQPINFEWEDWYYKKTSKRYKELKKEKRIQGDANLMYELRDVHMESWWKTKGT